MDILSFVRRISSSFNEKVQVNNILTKYNMKIHKRFYRYELLSRDSPICAGWARQWDTLSHTLLERQIS